MADNKYLDDEKDGEGESGKGGASGEIHYRYHDAFSGPLRDDLLPADERRLLLVHAQIHEDRVKRQFLKRRERAAEKRGELHYTAINKNILSGGGGSMSRYKEHPISKKLAGLRDPQTIGVPDKYEADTNKAELEHRLELDLSLQHRNIPRFTAPKPRPPTY